MTSRLVLAALALAGCVDSMPKPAAAPATRPAVADASTLVPIETPADRLLVTGRALPATMPVARTAVGSLPMNMIASKDRRFAFVSDMGYRQSLSCIDLRTGERVGELKYNNPAKNVTQGLYFGLALSADGRTLYVGTGRDNNVGIVDVGPDGTLKRAGKIETKKGDFPAGVALDSRGMLFVTSNEPYGDAAPLDMPGTLICFDSVTKNEVGRVAFDSYLGTTNYPLAVVATRDGSKVFVASQRDACVYVVDSREPTAMRVIAKIDTGKNPAALLMDDDEKRLFVSNSGSDTVSQIDVATNKVAHTVLLRPDVAKHVAGVTPLGMSLSPDGGKLYVAAADLNAVAVLEMEDDEDEHQLLGYIPAGWYPSAVVTDGQSLLIADAKGTRTRNPNPADPVADVAPSTRLGLPAATQEAAAPKANPNRHVSPNALIEGDVLLRKIPTKQEIKDGTKETLELARMTPRILNRANPLAHVGVKHVIYIVKENRTYDQVLGDLPQGNGDPSRCLFGREVTPNLHALAERFVLLDNFYDCGEVSGDGWVWSTQAMANEYVIKNVPYQYSKRGRVFDYEGTNNGYPTGGFPAKGPDGEQMSEEPRLANGGQAIPDVAEAPGGHLWDLLARHGKTFRNYGFFVSGSQKAKDGTRITPDNWPSAAGLSPGGHDLAGLTDVDFRRFDLGYADSDAPQRFFEQTGDAAFLRPTKTFGKYDAPSRFSEWKREFDQMLAKDAKGGAVPALMFVRFGTDHTLGMSGGKHSPRSMVADNDYAVGQLVEAVSHSAIWKDTAIVIIEDDAQNGPDHVDAHRSTCYVASPWVKKATVDHSFHNTVSCIRTMELLLGLPPMNSYDATSEPMTFFDASPSNDAPFVATLPDAKILAEKNATATPAEAPSPETRRMIRESDEMNFAIADKAPADRLTQIIWYSVRGPDVPQPPTPHGLTVDGLPAAKDDDDD